jgi:50S ribosomal subunit-associated GTPase HflX
MMNELLDDATRLQKNVQTLISEVRALRKEKESMLNKIDRLEKEMEELQHRKDELQRILDLNTLSAALTKKEDITELRSRITDMIKELNKAIYYIEQQGQFDERP